MINRIMTTKQKKFLEKTFECLGVDIDTFLLISELPNILAENKTLREENTELRKILIEQNESIVNTTKVLNTHLIEHSQSFAKAIWEVEE